MGWTVEEGAGVWGGVGACMWCRDGVGLPHVCHILFQMEDIGVYNMFHCQNWGHLLYVYGLKIHISFQDRECMVVFMFH